MASTAKVACVYLAAIGGAYRRSAAVDPSSTLAGGQGGGGERRQMPARAYFHPKRATRGLSQNISDYYRVLGSASAFTEELRRHRVGGTGQAHIFYLPEGPALLEQLAAERVGYPRHGALSEVRRLKAGETLESKVWPQWTMSGYTDPLGSAGLEVEQKAMNRLTESSFAGFLKELTNPFSAALKVVSRYQGNKDAADKVVTYLDGEFRSTTGISTCVQTFEVLGINVTNVIGFVKGTEPGTVTLGAHWDDLPASGQQAPGAEDDGSGTSAVLAAMKAFMGAGAKPKKSVYFVAFGGEEADLYGSDRFAEELKNPGTTSSPIPEACRADRTSDHTALIMDMIGYKNPSFSADTVLLETYTKWAPRVNNALAKANEVVNGGSLSVTFSNDPWGSDHESFLNRDFPAVLSIDNDGDTSKYLCYHKYCDTEDKVNKGFATKIAKMNLGGLLRLAGLN